MRVGVDARLVGRGLGIAHFVRQLVTHLDPSVEVIWYGASETAPKRVAEVKRVDHLPYPALDGFVGRRLAQRPQLDVMHFTGNTGWTHSSQPPFVLTVHDLIFLDTPIRARSLRQVVGHRYMRFNVQAAVRTAARVACPSQVTAAAVSDRLGPTSAPRAIPHGIERPPGCRPRPTPAQPTYAVAFSARDPRKGIDLALRGWLAADRKPERLKILAGAGLPAGFEEKVHPHVSQGLVELVPYLPRRELWELLEGASVLLHPSSAEGFGLPVLEAMAAGVPVISGLTATSSEIGPGAFLSIDAASPVSSIAAALNRLGREPPLRQKLIDLGRSNAERFKWRRAADEYLSLYREALDRSR